VGGVGGVQAQGVALAEMNGVGGAEVGDGPDDGAGVGDEAVLIGEGEWGGAAGGVEGDVGVEEGVGAGEDGNRR